MQLSELTGKTIRSGKYTRGVCTGIGISLKSKAIKFLLCSPHQNEEIDQAYKNTDFAVNINAIEDISNDEITLSRLRALSARNCAILQIGKPVYSEDGSYLGKITDVYIQNLIATHLKTDKENTLSTLTIAACSDVILLRKALPYPIGQSLSSPTSFSFLEKSDVMITKQTLRTAAENHALVRLTLSLPPFQIEALDNTAKKRKWF